MGTQQVVVSNKTSMTYRTRMMHEDMKPPAGIGAFIEHCLHVVMLATHHMDPKGLGQAILAIGLYLEHRFRTSSSSDVC